MRRRHVTGEMLLVGGDPFHGGSSDLFELHACWLSQCYIPIFVGCVSIP